MAYVYLHRRKDNNEPFYVGVGGLLSFDNYQRANANNWKGLASRSKFWKSIASKFGFTVEIVLDNCTKQEAFSEEIRLIKLYGRQDIETGILVNHTDGGDGRVGSSEEMKKKCGEKNIGKKWTEERRLGIKKEKPKRNNVAWNKGIPHTEKAKLNMSAAAKHKSKMSLETKQKISKSNSGKVFSKEARQKMSNYRTGKPTTGEKVQNVSTGLIYASTNEIAREFNISRYTLRKKLTGKLINDTNFRLFQNE